MHIQMHTDGTSIYGSTCVHIHTPSVNLSKGDRENLNIPRIWLCGTMDSALDF